MNYYNDVLNTKDRGIDYDLWACLYWNSQQLFTVDDIKQVLAVVEGESDGRDWRWVIALNDDLFCFLIGGCCYTGWDCHSYADSSLADTAHDAAKFENDAMIRASLIDQLGGRKGETWRDMKDNEFGITCGSLGVINSLP